MPPSDGPRARTTQKSLHLLEELLHRDTARITELSEELGMSKSTVHNHLNTLRQCGYVVKEGVEYRVGLKFLEVGGFIRSRMNLYQYAKPEISKLREQTGETIYLTTEEAGEGAVLIEAGPPSIDTEWYAGKRFSLFETPEGLTLLADLPELRREELLSDTSEGDTAPLREELSTIRADGHAVSTKTGIGEVWRIAVPIHGEDGSVAGALSLADQHDADMGSAKEGAIHAVKEAAEEIEQNLELAWYDSESVVTPKHSLSSYTER